MAFVMPARVSIYSSDFLMHPKNGQPAAIPVYLLEVGRHRHLLLRYTGYGTTDNRREEGGRGMVRRSEGY